MEKIDFFWIKDMPLALIGFCCWSRCFVFWMRDFVIERIILMIKNTVNKHNLNIN